MQKYIDMLQNAPHWIPFFGLATGKPSPFATRLIESGILALVPIIAGALYLIPKIEAKLESSAQLYQFQASQYTAFQMETANEIKEINKTVRKLEINDAVVQKSIADMQSTVNSIDDIANTKVRSIEGRIDSLEHRMQK